MAEQMHVMMFPWLAFGHMLPFLEFSKKLAARGIRISFVSTPRNLQRLPSVPPILADNINLVEIPLPSEDGLPEHCEATIDLQQEQIQYLKKAHDKLVILFEKLLHEDVPDLIFIDFAPYWIPEIAAKFGVATAFFSAYTAATMAYQGPPAELKTGKRRTTPEHFTKAPEWFKFPSLVAHRQDYAPRMLQNLHYPDASGISSGQRIAKIVEGCDFVAVRSCNEFEGEYISLLEELYQRPVLPIGLLPPVLEDMTHNAAMSNWFDTFKWLDRHEQKSVVFVAFGSEYKMPIQQVHELAYALELSRLPFIWILRKPGQVDSSDLLPPGFVTRTSDQGIVSLGWAPQSEILAHSAIGGCLFHSGWGSIIECLAFGLPLILMPMVSDQGLNARLLVEKGLGYEVPRNEDGSFNRDMVAKSMRLVMVAEEGELLRSRAAQMHSVFSNQELHDKYINKFVQRMSSYKRKKPEICNGGITSGNL